MDKKLQKFYQGKKILVTGGTGMIGIPLVQKLLEYGSKVWVASLDDPSRCHEQAQFVRADLTRFDQCLEISKNMDFVFHLAGIKGSPKMTKEKPASFFVPLLLMNTNMMEASRLNKVQRYLYTSTVGVYSPAPKLYEDDVWKTFPSSNDKFAGWAKRMGELQAESYQIEYGWDQIAIVRPANVYGPFDNFDLENGMVIPSLIRKVMDGQNPLTVWGDGSAIRDFIHAEDVALGMLIALESKERRPINLGSGTGVSIRQLVEIVTRYFGKKTEVRWDTSKPSGDKIRLMDVSRAKEIGIEPKMSIEKGIHTVMEWYQQNREVIDRRFNVFKASV